MVIASTNVSMLPSQLNHRSHPTTFYCARYFPGNYSTRHTFCS